MAVIGLRSNDRLQFFRTLDNEPKAEHSCGRGKKKGGDSTNGYERLAEVIVPMLLEALVYEAAADELEAVRGVTHDAET